MGNQPNLAQSYKKGRRRDAYLIFAPSIPLNPPLFRVVKATMLVAKVTWSVSEVLVFKVAPFHFESQHFNKFGNKCFRNIKTFKKCLIHFGFVVTLR